MAGANFDRIKNWQEEVLTHDDLNREIDNILEHFNTDGMASYSETLGQMQTQTNPGGLGTESLATSLAGEIERLRFVIARIIGDDVTYWYEAPNTSLSDLNAILGGGLPDNRIISSAKSPNSSQPIALKPDGATATLTLNGTSTPFTYVVNGTIYTINSDISISGLSLAPSTDNTALVNMPVLTGLGGDPQSSQWLGQFGTTIVIDTVGTEITSLIGKLAAFSITNGVQTEYFIAEVSSSTTLTNAQRGFFFNSNQAHVPAIPFSDDDTITLLRLTWVFATTAGTLAVTYNPPKVSSEAPTSPATGDYWFDTVNNQWKTFNSTAWIASNSTLIGVCAQDTTATIAARTFDPHVNLANSSTLTLKRLSATQVAGDNIGAQVDVYGSILRFPGGVPVWDMTTDLDTGLTEAANTFYFFYLTEAGKSVISDQAPIYRADLGGFYHAGETWRCVGICYNDANLNLVYEPKVLGRGYDSNVIIGSPRLAVGQTINSTASDVFAWGTRLRVGPADDSGTSWGPASGQWGTLVTMTNVEPGVYMAYGQYTSHNQGAIAATDVYIGVSNVDDPAGTGLLLGVNLAKKTLPTTSGHQETLQIACPVIVETPSNIYLRYSADTVDANLKRVALSSVLKLVRIDSLSNAGGR